MNAPLHAFRPVRLERPADDAHRLLTADPQACTTTATAEALHANAPVLRRWGLVAQALPSVDATITDDDELGSIAVRWRGDETVTGWPAMSARLLVSATGPTGCELTLVTARSQVFGLAAPVLSPLHRRQALDLQVGGFLHALADHLLDVALRPRETEGAPR